MQPEQIKWFLYVIHVPSVRKPDLFCNNRCDTIPMLATCVAVLRSLCVRMNSLFGKALLGIYHT